MCWEIVWTFEYSIQYWPDFKVQNGQHFQWKNGIPEFPGNVHFYTLSFLATNIFELGRQAASYIVSTGKIWGRFWNIRNYVRRFIKGWCADKLFIQQTIFKYISTNWQLFFFLFLFFLHFMFLLATMFKEIMCSGYKVLRWQTVYSPRLLLSSTNGQNTQNDNGVGISWSKHIYIWCHYDPQSFLKFRGAVYKSCTDNLFKKRKIRRKNNDCYNIVFSKECSK